MDKTKFFKGGEDSIEAEYFEKFFPIRLEISSITNAGWQKLLNEKLEEAFKDEILTFEEGNILSNTIPLSVELFRSLFYCYEMDLYPRDIIYFVNKAVYYYKVTDSLKKEKKQHRIPSKGDGILQWPVNRRNREVFQRGPI